MKQKDYVIGLDLGGTNSAFGIVDRRGRIIATTNVRTQEQGNAEQYVEKCCEALNDILREIGGIEKIYAMGIGAPSGNYYTGIIDNAANLPWKGEVPLAQLFNKRLNIPVVLTNDANAAAMGEMIYGAAKGMKNFIMITLGTGVGSGIVCNGQLVYGSDGFAGELGHIIIDRSENARRCGCGRKGCLETYCSAKGVAYTAKEMLLASNEQSLLRAIPFDEITSKDVAVAAEQGDKIARSILEQTGEILGSACANITAFYSPEAFIFFGGLAKAGDLLINPINKAYHKDLHNIYHRNPAKMILSELSTENAAILGASALGWEI